MKDIRILENLLSNLENNLEDIDIYNYEKYSSINTFIENYKINHREEVNKYLKKEGRLPLEEENDLDLTDILYIISSQIEEIKEAVKNDLNKEYLNTLNSHKQINISE